MLSLAAGLAVPMVGMTRMEPMEPEFDFDEDELFGEDVIGIGGGVGFEGGDEEAMSVEEAVTEANLAMVDLGLLIYNLENSDYPATLDELVTATASYPEGYLNMSEVPADGWGRALVYERVSDKEYRLRSVGADGVDDSGAGDDLAIE